MPLSSNTQLGPYRIVEPIGSGGMGEVYRARDTKLDRTVALKILPHDLAESEERRTRFLREARAASAIDHPNVAHIYEIGEADGVHFIAMQYVGGTSLAEKAQRGPLASADIINVGLQVADALDAAHGRGIVHRDIKPANLVLDERGQIKVLDFGLAKTLGRAQSEHDSDAATEPKTAAGMVMGTVQYMSPEQALGRDVDGRSDIFSLGVVLYELTTGRLPFSGASPTETIERIVNAQPEAIARFNYDVPAELERIIRKCLEKAPADRYQSAKELVVDLRHLKRDSESGGRIAAAPTKRHRSLALGAGSLVLVALAAGGLFWFLGNSERIDSLAVLPFENGSDDPDAEYFSDGVTESIINSLSRLPNVKVISRTSAFHYKGRAIDPRTVGQELEVEALVLGRVVQRDDELVISAELVRTADSGQVWGEQYRRTAADVFDIQKDMAREITEALRVQLSEEQEGLLTKQYTQDAAAYEAYLKGRYQWNRRTEDGLRRAIDFFREAIERDGNYAPAFAGLADSYISSGFYYSPPHDVFPEARAAAERALEVDPTLGEAHASLGYIKAMYDWDFADSESEFQRAIELDPAYATAYHWYSEPLIITGRSQEAMERIRKAVELDPLSRIINATLGLWLAYTERHQEAERQFEKTLELDPSWPLVHLWRAQNYELQGLFSEAIPHYETSVALDEASFAAPFALGSLGHAYAKSGRIEEARAVLEQLDELAESRYVRPYERAVVYAGLGDLELCFEWLERAYEERSTEMPFLAVLPIRADIENDPRFAELVRRLGLEP